MENMILVITGNISLIIIINITWYHATINCYDIFHQWYPKCLYKQKTSPMQDIEKKIEKPLLFYYHNTHAKW